MTSAIYLFHMPLFFVLSGFLFKSEPVSLLVAKRSRTLLIPYLFFAAAISLVSTRSVSVDILIGGVWVGGVLATCWFVTCLFLTQVVYNAADRRLPTMLPLIGLCVLATALMPAVGLPWSLDVVPAALIYFWAGHMLRVVPGAGAIARLACWPIAVVGVAAHVRLGIPGAVDLRFDVFGTPVIGPVVAVAASCCLFDLARLAARAPVVARVLEAPGRASLVILFVHMLMVHRVVQAMPEAPPWADAVAILALGCAVRWAMLRLPVVGPVLIGEPRAGLRATRSRRMVPTT